MRVAFSSGGASHRIADGFIRPPGARSRRSEALAQDLAALSVLPRLSLLDGRAAIQRTQDIEIGYEKQDSRYHLNLTGYQRESEQRGHDHGCARGRLRGGRSAARYFFAEQRSGCRQLPAEGFAASVSRALGNRVQVGTSFGSSGALAADGQDMFANTADALRDRLHTSQRFWASARASARLPVTGTVITGSYEWMDYDDTIMPDHVYLTQNLYLQPA